MQKKICDNQNRKGYVKKENGTFSEAYVNQRGGWTDYLVSDKVIFSHRINDRSMDDLLEKLHYHDYYEISAIFGGEGVEYISERETVSLHRGTVILTKPMRFHMFRLSTPTHYDRYVLYFKDIEGIFPDSAIMDFTKNGDASCAIFELPEQPILSYFQSAENALATADSPYASAKAYLNICNIFLLLSDHKAPIKEKVPMFAPNFISRIKEYIDENFLSIHSVKTLSSNFFYSREYVSRTFRKYYNTPIYEYISNRKMQYAALLLKQGASVEDSARESGFFNMSSFIKLFQKLYGCTPSQYKEKQR